ncbi:ATP-binding protein [Streptomyces sp. RB6PN25]|uniref:ATP-binding protein n=1 Tax=Streptomyces humicola TaxID=2953240 RepID=A0ABT1PZE1_9ACTN|nr:ATP-binding protein [Streptomyces humicola]MCQ4083036.1 ATP-binding protein [Streptomyces humicola]
MNATSTRPTLTELRLSAFKSHRGAGFSLGPVTVVSGRSGSGKSSVLEALGVLTRLACGDGLGEVFAAVRGGAAACVPQGARPDAEGRRGLRIGCTVDGPVGPVRLDLAVQAEPELRIVGERLTGAGEVLLSTALRDPARRTVQAAWHTAGLAPVTRAPLPDDRLATALLPLRVAGKTQGQLLVLAAVEQVLVALRAVFAVDPQPRRMRGPVGVGDGMLRGDCENLSAVLHRTQGECRTRHAALVAAARAVCDGPVEGLTVMRRVLARSGGGAAREAVMAAVDHGPLLGITPVDRLGDGELRFLALALVLLTGPGVLEMDQSAEVLPAQRAMTVLADGLDYGLDLAQTRELLSLAVRAAERGHVRLVGTVHDACRVAPEGFDGVTVIALGRRSLTGAMRERAAERDPGRAIERVPEQGGRREPAPMG